MAEGNYSDLMQVIAEEETLVAHKRAVLKDLDMFVLDNSLRESTVGQLRGHTLENKWAILNEVKKCGFKHIIVSAFSHVPRVDDAFVKELAEKEEDKSCYYAFTEIGEGKDLEKMPVGLEKMKEHGLRNPIFEINLAGCPEPRHMQDLLEKRINYTYEKLAKDAKIFVNLRDMPFAMEKCPKVVFDIVKFLGNMPEGVRPFGVMFEEPTGRFLPEVVGGWTKAIRMLMDQCDWQSGKLLVHIHKKWCFSEVTQLECLSSGADGVWASVCEEGAALGHACTTVSMMNLIRMGNKKVLKNYNCTYLREAAINVTKITTTKYPHPMQPIYGDRALDVAFDFGGIAGGKLSEGEFDIAKFFGIDPPKRITTLATTNLVLERLKDLFGENEQFTEELAANMLTQMKKDLADNNKEEYMSEIGLAMLFEKSGGHLTEKLRDRVLQEEENHTSKHKPLINEVRKIWDEWDAKEDPEFVGDDCLEFYSFYNGFMAPYFGCYECDIARKGIQALDMDKDNKIDWSEFVLYLKWALRQYPQDIHSCDDLLEVAFKKGLIPAMQDEIVKQSA